MNRRTFIGTVAGGLLTAPLAAQTQKVVTPRIGWLTSSVIHAPNVDAFRQGMRVLGYPDVSIAFRAAAGQVDRLPALAAELVALPADVIVIDGGVAAVAARQVTATVPIVFGAAGDPVRLGLAASLARPGGNVTGFMINTGPGLTEKRLEMLREVVPALKRIAIVHNPNEGSRREVVHIDTVAKVLGIQFEVIEARDAAEIERAFSNAAQRRVGAVLMISDVFLWSLRGLIVAQAARQRLPVIYMEREFVEAGGLIAYGPHVADNFRRAATHVDKILKGAKPADLPIEQPTKFVLAINVKTAKALGLTIPQSLLLRADEVIQ